MKADTNFTMTPEFQIIVKAKDADADTVGIHSSLASSCKDGEGSVEEAVEVEELEEEASKEGALSSGDAELGVGVGVGEAAYEMNEVGEHARLL